MLLRTADGALTTLEVFLNAGYGYDVGCEIVCEQGTLALAPTGADRDQPRRRTRPTRTPPTGGPASPTPTASSCRPGSTRSPPVAPLPLPTARDGLVATADRGGGDRLDARRRPLRRRLSMPLPPRPAHPGSDGRARAAVGRRGLRVDRRAVHRLRPAPHAPADPRGRLPRRRPCRRLRRHPRRIERSYGSYEAARRRPRHRRRLRRDAPHRAPPARAARARGRQARPGREAARPERRGRPPRSPALAAERGLFCMEALWTFCLPKFDVVRQLLDAGALGEVRTVLADLGESFAADHRILRADLAGGPMLDLGTYPVVLCALGPRRAASRSPPAGSRTRPASTARCPRSSPTRTATRPCCTRRCSATRRRPRRSPARRRPSRWPAPSTSRATWS